MEANRLHLLPKTEEGLENIGGFLNEKRENLHERMANYRNSEHRSWNVNMFTGEFDEDHPKLNIFGITEFTLYHFMMGFVSGFF